MKAGRFREKIIEELSFSGFVRVRETLEQAAADIGVLPETLYEARQRYLLREKLRLEERGGRRFLMQMTISQKLRDRWDMICEAQNLHGPGLLRAGIHEYLRGTHEPEMLPDPGTPHHEQLVVTMTYAAREALHRRCREKNISVASLLRSLVVHISTGIPFVPGATVPIPWQAMYWSVDKYFTPVPEEKAGSTGSPAR